MSSMLEQAIVDAEQLKETAKQTAEETVVEKYQDEIKEAIEKILEQDGDENAMTTNSQGDLELIDNLPAAQTADMDDVVEIDLTKLEEMMEDEMKNDGLDVEEMVPRETIAEDVTDDDSTDADEDIEINEENLAQVIGELLGEGGFFDDSEKEELAQASEEEAEKAGGQVGAVYKGVAESDEAELEEEAKPDFPDVDDDGDTDEPISKSVKDKKKAGKRNPRDNMGGGHGDYKIAQEKPKYPYKESRGKTLQKENKSLLKEQQQMNSKVQLLKEKVDKYGTVIKQLKDKLDESNVTNAKLLYQNRILNSVSLNERQKDKIVEAISNANSVEEAKLIFETLQSAVGVSKKKSRRPESLNEVVSRSSSAFIPRKEVQPKADAFSERMKRLAGLK